jgi:chaperonin GroES
VISIGDGHVTKDGKRHPLSLRVGDRVIFSSYAGDEITVGEDQYLLLRESDVLAVY